MTDSDNDITSLQQEYRELSNNSLPKLRIVAKTPSFITALYARANNVKNTLIQATITVPDEYVSLYRLYIDVWYVSHAIISFSLYFILTVPVYFQYFGFWT